MDDHTQKLRPDGESWWWFLTGFEVLLEQYEEIDNQQKEVWPQNVSATKKPWQNRDACLACREQPQTWEQQNVTHTQPEHWGPIQQPANIIYDHIIKAHTHISIVYTDEKGRYCGKKEITTWRGERQTPS